MVITQSSKVERGRTDPQGSIDLKYWLALLRAPGVGPIKYQQILKVFTSPKNLFTRPFNDIKDRIQLTQTLRDYLARPDWDSVDNILDWLNSDNKNQILTLADPRYPSLLAQIADPPPVLFVHGDIELLQYPQLAIVGSRNPSHGGNETAFEFARYLSSAGLVITSGLAVGIDASSHRGALAGNELSIAVTGTGLDRVYPAKHRGLAHEIAQQGTLVSEYIPDTGPMPSHFPRRNRIISGLSVGTLVVEAAQKSGSLITARLALEQGREVFAIPGSIHNPLARGCHKLIRDGAKLVETAHDILEELGPLISTALSNQAQPGKTIEPGIAVKSGHYTDHVRSPGIPIIPTRQHQELLDNLGYQPMTIDALVDRCGLTPEAISSMLLELELLGYISSAGGAYSRIGFKG